MHENVFSDALCAAGPSAVVGLAVSSMTCSSLGLSWQPGPGRTQRFRLQLQDLSGTSERQKNWTFCPICQSHGTGFFCPTGLLKNETVESTATQRTLFGLTPGRLYRVTMVTEAGELQNNVTIEAQTGRDGRAMEKKETEK